MWAIVLNKEFRKEWGLRKLKNPLSTEEMVEEIRSGKWIINTFSIFQFKHQAQAVIDDLNNPKGYSILPIEVKIKAPKGFEF
jgi:hypothetical protein